MSYAVEWIPGAVLLGTVLSLLIVPSVALIALVVLAVAAVMTWWRSRARCSRCRTGSSAPSVGSSRSGASSSAPGCLTGRSVTDEFPHRSQLVGPPTLAVGGIIGGANVFVG